jgi:hypothetical protein
VRLLYVLMDVIIMLLPSARRAGADHHVPKSPVPAEADLLISPEF